MDMNEVLNKFDTVYKTIIVPKISPLEKFRQEKLKESKKIINILFGKKQSIIEEYKLKTKNELTDIIFSVFTKVKTSADVVDMEEIKELGFCCNANNVSYGSITSFDYKNLKINATETTIQRVSSDKEDNSIYALFNGLALRIQTKVNLASKTILSRKAKDFSTKERENVYLGSKVNFRYNNTEKLDTLTFSESETGKMFEVFSNDETRARKFITDKLIEKIKLLRDSFSSAGISLAFINSDVYVFIEEDKFFFENLDIEKEISNKEEFKNVYKKIVYLINLINYFN